MSTDNNEEITEETTVEHRTPTWVEWVRSISIAITLALLIRWPVAEPYKIPSGSMEPTFMPGDRIFVDKHVYGIRYPLNGFRIPFTRKNTWYAENYIWRGQDIERWDIVVFKSNEPGAEKDTLVKRVVGLPGERIQIRRKATKQPDGRLIPVTIEYRGERMVDTELYINGEPMPIPDFMPPLNYTHLRGLGNGYALLPDDEHTLIPEDHVFLMGDNSAHSRDGRWFGFMPRQHIIGRVTSIWWPVGRWRDLTGYTDSPWWYLFWFTLGTWILLRLFIGRSWSPRGDVLGGLVERTDHVLILFALGIPVPFTRTRLTPGRALKRGDLVLYYCKGLPRGHEEGLLGIVAGTPGDKVFIDNGKLRVNDQPVNGKLNTMSFPKEGTDDKFGRSKGKEFSIVPDDHVYILTEEGHADTDSRTLGWISRKDINGIATRTWWPITKTRSLKL